MNHISKWAVEIKLFAAGEDSPSAVVAKVVNATDPDDACYVASLEAVSVMAGSGTEPYDRFRLLSVREMQATAMPDDDEDDIDSAFDEFDDDCSGV
jgi:hypothetical protein